MRVATKGRLTPSQYIERRQEVLDSEAERVAVATARVRDDTVELLARLFERVAPEDKERALLLLRAHEIAKEEAEKLVAERLAEKDETDV